MEGGFKAGTYGKANKVSRGGATEPRRLVPICLEDYINLDTLLFSVFLLVHIFTLSDGITNFGAVG